MATELNGTITPTANVYFDGKCVSYSITMSDGSRKSTGVIFPAELTFTTAAPEVMELVQGVCEVRFPGSDEWQRFEGGQQFSVAGDSAFDIKIIENLHYICHYG